MTENEKKIREDLSEKYAKGNWLNPMQQSLIGNGFRDGFDAAYELQQKSYTEVMLERNRLAGQIVLLLQGLSLAQQLLYENGLTTKQENAWNKFKEQICGYTFTHSKQDDVQWEK